MKYLRLPPGLINLKGELFSSTFTYGVTAAIKLVSSLILTRILNPEAYGIFAIVYSILVMLELISDVGTVALLVRHQRGGEKTVVHTIWTVRLIRCCVSFCLLFTLAPVLAEAYRAPVLTNAFRTLSFWFLLYGSESLSFVLAQRDQRARISNYAEMFSGALMTVFVIFAARILKSHYALIYGALFQRGLLTIASHMFYRNIGVGIAFDREVLKDQFRLARFVFPSSILTMVLTQYDKLVLARMFSLNILGIYGIAGSMVGPISGIISHNARVVLYARAAQYYRSNRSTAAERYYSENNKLFLVGIVLPAMLAGFSHSLVAILYDARYAEVGYTLMVVALGALVSAFQNTSENIIVASGSNHIVLAANVVRLLTVIPLTLVGFWLYGYRGFLWFNLFAALLTLGYYYHEQQKIGALKLRREFQLFALGLIIFVLCRLIGELVLMVIPTNWLHLSSKRH